MLPHHEEVIMKEQKIKTQNRKLIYIDGELHAKLKQHAKDEGYKLYSIANEAIDAFLKEIK